MADSYLPLLQAAISGIKANGSISALVGTRVYSDVPDNPTFPFIVVEISSSPYDTKTSEGMEHTLTCDIYSRETTPKTNGDIRAALYTLLHRQETALTGVTINNIICNGLAVTFKEPDGKTWHGVIQFRVVIGG